MTLKQLQKCESTLKQIRELDQSIANYSRIAKELIETNEQISFCLSMPVKKNQFPSNAEPRFDTVEFAGHQITYFPPPQPQKTEYTISESIQENVSPQQALRLLAILLEYKQEQRKELITELKKMGVKLS